MTKALSLVLLGGVYVREHPLDFGAGFEVMEVAYGWADVRGGLSVPDSARRPAGT